MMSPKKNHSHRNVLKSGHFFGLGGRLSFVMYPLIRFTVNSFLRSLWRMKVYGTENIPLSGRLIVASNHVSLSDPPTVACGLTRKVCFMAKQELFEIPFLGALIRQLNAFPIRRVERDVGAFKTAHKILMAEGALLLFPEGHRQKKKDFGKAKSGVGMLSIKTNSPIIPTYLHNTNKLKSYKKILVYFGKPISPHGETDYTLLSNKVMEAINQLKERCLKDIS